MVKQCPLKTGFPVPAFYLKLKEWTLSFAYTCMSKLSVYMGFLVRCG